MHNAAGCGRVQFRQQLAPTRAAIQEQQQRLWDNVNRKTVRDFNAWGWGEVHWHHELDRSGMPSFECSDFELSETQEAFLSM